MPSKEHGANSVPVLATPVREPYPASRLEPLIAPKSVAVVGASQRPNAFGTRALTNALHSYLPGPVWAINPNYQELHGVRCCPSIAAIPEAVDCLIIAVPAASVLHLVREGASSRKVRSILIFSSGLGETGSDGKQVEREIAEIAQRYSIPICGPNTVGIFNFTGGTQLSFITDIDMEVVPAGGLALASQSAGTGVALAHARHRGLPLSHCLLAGNSCDVDVLDFASYALDQPEVNTVGLVIEGLRNPRALIGLGERARKSGKAIIALKTGRSKSAAAVVESHTGSMVGNYDCYKAAFDRAGIVCVETIEDLLETSALFAKAQRATRRGVGVLTTSGGSAVMAADEADSFAVELPQPAVETTKAIASLTPDFASVANPADLTASMSQNWSILTQALLAFAHDPSYAAVVAPLPAPDLGNNHRARPQAIVEAARRSPVPLCVVWLSGWREAPPSDILDFEPKIIMFRSLRRCMRALSLWLAWSKQIGTPQRSNSTLAPQQIAKVRTLIDQALEKTGTRPLLLDEVQSRALLQVVDIPVTKGDFAINADEACTVGDHIGYPVVVKGVVRGVAHKSDIGAVELRISCREELRTACSRIETSVHGKLPNQPLDGFLVCKMEPPGFEAIVGATRDPLFGPTVVAGAGGTAVEQLDDIGLDLAPCSVERAASIISKLHCARIIFGARGVEARDTDAFARVAAATSALIMADERIKEIDINPLVLRAKGQGAIALDALIRCQTHDE